MLLELREVSAIEIVFVRGNKKLNNRLGKDEWLKVMIPRVADRSVVYNRHKVGAHLIVHFVRQNWLGNAIVESWGSSNWEWFLRERISYKCIESNVRSFLNQLKFYFQFCSCCADCGVGLIKFEKGTRESHKWYLIRMCAWSVFKARCWLIWEGLS